MIVYKNRYINADFDKITYSNSNPDYRITINIDTLLLSEKDILKVLNELDVFLLKINMLQNTDDVRDVSAE